MPRIGYLCVTVCAGSELEAFLQGLRELGYVDGRNIAIEYRVLKMDPSPVHTSDPFYDLGPEVARLKVDVIVASHPTVIRAAKMAAKTIPVVMVTTGYDPVETGLVASLGRPGGNITGLFLLLPELIGKRLELLKEAVPAISRVAVLWDHATGSGQFSDTEVAARSLSLQLQSLAVQDQDDFDTAFGTATRGRAQALLVVESQLLFDHRTRIAELATKSRLPAMFASRESVEAGGLMFYGPSRYEMFRRAATYVARILKGAKPAELPVEQPMRFELVINLKTAKALGLRIPQSVLMRADQVIE
jgi:putative ABC transport system substrate-binding protein